MVPLNQLVSSACLTVFGLQAYTLGVEVSNSRACEGREAHTVHGAACEMTGNGGDRENRRAQAPYERGHWRQNLSRGQETESWSPWDVMTRAQGVLLECWKFPYLDLHIYSSGD